MYHIPYDSLYLKGIHGIEHVYRVLLLVLKVAEGEGLPKSQQDILEFCAIFHDIGRIDDGVDALHGKRSVIVLKQNNFFGLVYFDTNFIHYIIENHCITDTIAYTNVSKFDLPHPNAAVALLKAFKDSDNLDRVRLGDFDGSYLRCPSSKDLIKTAQENYRSLFTHSEIINEFDAVIHRFRTELGEM